MARPSKGPCRIAIATLRALRDIEGGAGVHLMGHRNEATRAEIIALAGLRAQAQPA